MVNNHFVDDYLLYMVDERELVSIAKNYLIFFCEALGAIISDHKIEY